MIFLIENIISYLSCLKATNGGPNRYPDLPIDIPNYLDTHGYNVDIYITFNFIIRFHELKCPCKGIIKATNRGKILCLGPQVVALTTTSIFFNLSMIYTQMKW